MKKKLLGLYLSLILITVDLKECFLDFCGYKYQFEHLLSLLQQHSPS